MLIAVQPNLVVGAAGAVLALITGSLLVADWRDLTELRDWEATFETDATALPPRSATVGPAPNNKATERHNLTHENVTTVRVELTWTDPSFPASAPEVRLTVRDSANRVRGSAAHRGGAVGIEVDVEIVPVDDVPDGRHRFSARDDPLDVFYQRWPPHPEGQGIWTFEVHNTASGTGAGSIVYTLRVEYDHYQGSVREIPKEPSR